jgi:hypothetical protein
MEKMKESWAVTNTKTTDMLSGESELFRLLEEGEEAIRLGRKRPLDEAMNEIRSELAKEK